MTQPSPEPGLSIRRAMPADAEQIVRVLERIASERVHSAIDRPFTVPQERSYLQSLSSRETTHVAVAASGNIVGYQSLDLWSPMIHSMRHVGQLGTFLLPEWRRRGVGRALFLSTREFARQAGYEKFVIQVRASNLDAQAFYRNLGFFECGRFTRQVRMGDMEDDEVLMEFFL